MTPGNPEQPDPPDTALAKLDAFMADSPWHPRLIPFFVYIILGLFVLGLAVEAAPVTRPFVYTLVVALVCVLLWRYRRLTPELNIKFHWLAVPTGVGLLFAWVYLGYATNWAAREVADVPYLGPVVEFCVDTSNPVSQAEAAQMQGDGTLPKHAIQRGQEAHGDAWYWATMVLRLLGMALVVPLFEELFVRSAVLRGTFSRSKTWRGILQVLAEMPLIGERVQKSKAGQQADAAPPAFTEQFKQTPIGMISVFSVIASTVVFMLSHQRRDWLGCVACGVVWCLLVWWTNRPRPRKGETWESLPEGGRYGLGPVVWSHGITNALLWAWTLRVGDWQFL